MNKKKLTLTVVLAMLGIGSVSAQAQFDTKEYLDVNRFKATHLVHGDMWWDPVAYTAGLEYPKGTGKHASFLGSIWVTGADASGNLYASATTYRADPSDYWPGPLDASDTTSYAESEKWAHIWKINRSDINHFLALSTLTSTTIPAVILEWPAKGNIYAKGNAGASLAVVGDMAPFVDTDHDGIYDATKGDYPDMKGDQMLWWVFNDNLNPHLSTKGQAFKFEYHVSAYAYNRGTAVDRMLFYEYEVLNKSDRQYKNLRIALYSDADLGNANDDYIAFDSTRRVGIEYNANSYDMPNGVNCYGDHPPMTGATLLEIPGDHYPDAMLPAGTFNYYELTASGPLRAPNTPASFFNYMHAYNYDGGKPYFFDGSYAFNLKGASACDTHWPLADRRYLLASADYTFDAGTKTRFAFAFVATDTNGNDCAAFNPTEITDLADSAWNVYYNPLPALAVHDPIAAAAQVKIYPNPATDQLFIEIPDNKPLRETAVYDMTGRKVQVQVTVNGNKLVIDTRALSPGVYTLSCTGDAEQYKNSFVVQHH